MIDNLRMAAVRSRTPSSAGMQNVESKEEVDPGINEKMLRHLTIDFTIADKGARRTNQFILNNLAIITLENEMAQCSQGHSCKVSSKEKLHRIRDEIAKQTIKSRGRVYLWESSSDYE